MVNVDAGHEPVIEVVLRNGGLLRVLNSVDPQAWLADVLARIADHKIIDLAALLPWSWRREVPVDRAA